MHYWNIFGKLHNFNYQTPGRVYAYCLVSVGCCIYNQLLIRPRYEAPRSVIHDITIIVGKYWIVPRTTTGVRGCSTGAARIFFPRGAPIRGSPLLEGETVPRTHPLSTSPVCSPHSPVWRSGSVVRRMNEVRPTLHWARLVLGWVIVVWRVYHLSM